jgi:hypothetical protein
MTNDTVTAWLLRCPECGERAAVELPENREAGGIGIELCACGHPLVFQYDGATIETLAVVRG